MNDDASERPRRGRITPDLDVPESRPGADKHDEWRIDESIEETFPASDAPAAVQPGSLASTEPAPEKRRP